MPVTINGTSGLSGVDGSAGTPAVQGSDTNTGVYFPAADTLSASTGGTERMRIDSSGNVGIGTTPSAFRLTVRPHIQITNANFATLELLNDTGIQARFIADSANSPNTASIGTLSNHDFKLITNNTERMRIDSSGNVGIGATPSYTLDVIKSGTVQARFGSSAGATTGGAVILSTSASQGIFGGGLDYNGSAFVARSTSASAVLCGSGTIQLWANAGLTAGNTFTPTARMQLDTAGNFLQISSGGLGYGTGSGGTVTQATSKSTGVTLNKTNGQIVTSNSSLGANSITQFVVTNSTVAATDVVMIMRASGGAAAGYNVWCAYVNAGAFGVNIENVTGGALAEALTLNFVIIKGVTS